ncbi:kinase-like protein [Auriscalpium vulgare]|uniref:Kinase-like protein n=1 Tax=Auriscalpium vulgare TaxID=40419 RepID=A0ACB8S8V4_9AGAM|nr:kinase-like protein [Auriscalpium vulgare]
MAPSYAYDIYKDELLCYGYGQAIWEPAPDEGQPGVLLGDVGYMFQGAFQRLFNIHLPRRHRFQPSIMPEYFEALTVDETMIKLRHLQPGAYCSTSVHAQTVDGSVATPVSLVGGEVTFKTFRQRGAVLALPESAQRVDGRTSRIYEAYIAQHCDRWLAYAHHKGLNVRIEDILLVTGCDLAKSWAMAAFVSSEVNARAALKVDLSPVGGPLCASASMQWRSVHQMHVNHHWGPDSSAPSFSALMERLSVGSNSSPESSLAEHSNPDPLWLSRTLLPGFDQCIFVRGYHMKRRLPLLPRSIKAFAEHRDERDEREDKDECTDVATMGDEYPQSEYVVEALDRSDQVRSQPFVHALEYVLEDSKVDLAIVHDDDVTPYLQASPDCQSVVSLLSRHRPTVMLTNQGSRNTVGTLHVQYQGDSSSNCEVAAWPRLPLGSVFRPPEVHLFAYLLPLRPGIVSRINLPKVMPLAKIGRSAAPLNDIVLSGINIGESHCEIEWNGETELNSIVTVTDASSSGTILNGRRMHSGRPTKLRDGDVLAFGSADQRDEYRYMYRQLAHTVPPGSFHDKYDVFHGLGTGAFATVMSGVERATGKAFAVKIVHRTNIGEKVGDDVEREITLLMTFNHPNIICLKEAFFQPHDVDSNVFIVLELVDGGDLLDHIINSDGLPEAEAKDYTRQLCRAIEYIHNKNVIHGDLKPENVLLTKSEPRTVKLGDFGASRVVPKSTLLQKMSAMPSYVAPEMLDSNSSMSDKPVVDSWSVGAITFSMLTNDPLYTNLPSSDTKQMPIDWHALSLRQVSEAGKKFLHRLLERDHRYRMQMTAALSHEWLKAPSLRPSVVANAISVPPIVPMSQWRFKERDVEGNGV